MNTSNNSLYTKNTIIQKNHVKITKSITEFVLYTILKIRRINAICSFNFDLFLFLSVRLLSQLVDTQLSWHFLTVLTYSLIN